MKPAFAALYKESYDIMGYLDDSILFGDNYDECKAAVLKSCEYVSECRFPSPTKKVFSNTKQEIDFLGFTINSKNMTLKLTKQKV